MSGNPTEAEARRALIDQQLVRAGWNKSYPRQVITELHFIFRLQSIQLSARPELPTLRNSPITRYVDVGGLPLALVKAKRDGRDALASKCLAEHYSERILVTNGRRHFIFLAN